MKKLKEQLKDIFENEVKGSSYLGDFRPYHGIFVDIKEHSAFEMFQASNNFIFQDRPHDKIEVWRNGNEGRYDLKGVIEDLFAEGFSEKDKLINLDFEEQDLPISLENWGEWEYYEKAQWMLENNYEGCQIYYEDWWDDKVEMWLDNASGALKEVYMSLSEDEDLVEMAEVVSNHLHEFRYELSSGDLKLNQEAALEYLNNQAPPSEEIVRRWLVEFEDEIRDNYEPGQGSYEQHAARWIAGAVAAEMLEGAYSLPESLSWLPAD